MADQTQVYFYDPCTNLYTGTALVSEEEQKLLGQTYTTTKVIATQEGKLIVYDSLHDNWHYISQYCYRIDANGYLLETYSNPLPLNTVSDDLIEEPLTVKFTYPRWNGSAWEEGATKEYLQKAIDTETNYLISKWCFDQSKCEEYYLNKGIESNTDAEYQVYKAAKAQIIAAQKQKKIAAGVDE